jgi:SUN domain-containing protein 1/2
LHADKIGKPDYALASAGATIVESRTSPTYSKPTGFIYSYFTGNPYNSPSTILDPDLSPGNCWAFAGSTGYVSIRLVDAVFPTEFSLEHIPASISYNEISSAPKEFQVYVRLIFLHSNLYYY